MWKKEEKAGRKYIYMKNKIICESHKYNKIPRERHTKHTDDRVQYELLQPLER